MEPTLLTVQHYNLARAGPSASVSPQVNLGTNADPNVRKYKSCTKHGAAPSSAPQRQQVKMEEHAWARKMEFKCELMLL